MGVGFSKGPALLPFYDVGDPDDRVLVSGAGEDARRSMAAGEDPSVLRAGSMTEVLRTRDEGREPSSTVPSYTRVLGPLPLKGVTHAARGDGQRDTGTRTRQLASHSTRTKYTVRAQHA